jgi:hypothetical protein
MRGGLTNPWILGGSTRKTSIRTGGKIRELMDQIRESDSRQVIVPTR